MQATEIDEAFAWFRKPIHPFLLIANFKVKNKNKKMQTE